MTSGREHEGPATPDTEESPQDPLVVFLEEQKEHIIKVNASRNRRAFLSLSEDPIQIFAGYRPVAEAISTLSLPTLEVTQLEHVVDWMDRMKLSDPERHKLAGIIVSAYASSDIEGLGTFPEDFLTIKQERLESRGIRARSGVRQLLPQSLQGDAGRAIREHMGQRLAGLSTTLFNLRGENATRISDVFGNGMQNLAHAFGADFRPRALPEER